MISGIDERGGIDRNESNCIKFFNEIQMTKKAVKRVQFIHFQSLRVLFERDIETLSEQTKKQKEELKIKIKDDESFNVDDYVLISSKPLNECYF